ncbi:MAG: PAS domain-containing protein [Rhodospirillales bacterium]|nr:PAS domain-containing protein [Rhodospirillales bacterium]
MGQPQTTLTGVERRFSESDVIVSKTDLRGVITYVNRSFMKISGYSEPELLGLPHSLVRHPEMPRAIFKLLWEVLGAGREVFAYVLNRCKSGDHYWVFAHVTPSFDRAGKVVGYHSFRRVPERRILDDAIAPLYRQILDEERRHPDRKEGLEKSFAMVNELLKKKGVSYDRWIFSL